uniref:Putative conserved secreted protein n=1 Tax=Rhipicephalus microplus TaxID=6941 RepID=A0A6G5A551_RHIMP
MVSQATTLCFFLLVAGWATAVVSEKTHQPKRPPELSCERGMVFVCKDRCRQGDPKRTGYCDKDFHCVCITAPSGHGS